MTWWKRKADHSGMEWQQLETSGQRPGAAAGKQGGSCRNDGTKTEERGRRALPCSGVCLGKMETSLTLSSEEGEFVLFDVQSQVRYTVKAATDGCVGFVPYASR